MAKIKKVWREQSVGRCVKGENFQKGDYIPTKTEYWADIGGQIIQLSPELIRALLGCIRITDKRLDDLAGKDSDLVRKK
nr:MAG TPA: hypothetical protein [Caudoviricetes sp.]